MSRSGSVLEERLLIAAAQAHDERAFEELVRRHSPQMYAAACKMVGEPAIAEEAVQEAWVAAWKGMTTFAGRSALSTWLHRLVLVSAWRLTSAVRKAPRPTIDAILDDTLDQAPSAELSASERVEHDAVRRAVAELDEPLRHVVVLYHFSGLSYDELAQVVGESEATVRGRLYRGRRQLAITLREWRCSA